MMFGTSEEQQELRSSVKRFVADRAPCRRVRRADGRRGDGPRGLGAGRARSSGLQGIAIPEEYGGSGFSFAEQAIVLEELGAGLYGGPYLASAVLAATALLASPDEAARQQLLPGIASGETIATVAFTEDDGSWDPAAIRLAAAKHGDGWVLDGHKSFVLDGASAGLILAVAVADGGAVAVRRRRRRGRADRDGAADPGPDPPAGPAGVRVGARGADRRGRRGRRDPGQGAGRGRRSRWPPSSWAGRSGRWT